jgi:hypothetical protein
LANFGFFGQFWLYFGFFGKFQNPQIFQQTVSLFSEHSTLEKRIIILAADEHDNDLQLTVLVFSFAANIHL